MLTHDVRIRRILYMHITSVFDLAVHVVRVDRLPLCATLIS